MPFTLFIGGFTDLLCLSMPLSYATVCSTAIFTPFIEEFAKAYPLLYRHLEAEKSLFTLGFLGGLGFGISEFFVYVFTLGVPIQFRLMGILFHAASTSITAYGIANNMPVRFYITAVLLHFANNFSALFGPWWFIGGLASIALTYFFSWRLYVKTKDKSVQSLQPVSM